MTDTTEKTPNNSIQEAIARAKAGAGALAQSAPGLPEAGGAVIQASSTGVPGAYTGGQPPASLDGFLDSGVNLKPDFWLTTKNTGFGVKDHNVPLDFDLGPLGLALPSDMQAFYGLRVNINGTATYYKTVDRVTCLKTGRPWGQLITEAANQGAREYRGFDIRLVALEDIKDLKGAVVVEAGKTLGYSTSITNFDDVASFAKKVRDAGLFGTDLVVSIHCDVRKNDKNKDGWGAIVFTDFTPFTPEIAEAAAAASQ